MTKSEKAVELFNKDMSCSQSVLAVFAEEYGLEEKKAFKIACGFGGGMARTGNICGAVTGAIMVIGLKYGRIDANDIDAREKTYAFTDLFFEEFKKLHGSLVCKELLGVDISTPEGLAAAKPLHEICVKIVADAVNILEKHI